MLRKPESREGGKNEGGGGGFKAEAGTFVDMQIREGDRKEHESGGLNAGPQPLREASRGGEVQLERE